MTDLGIPLVLGGAFVFVASVGLLAASPWFLIGFLVGWLAIFVGFIMIITDMARIEREYDHLMRETREDRP